MAARQCFCVLLLDRNIGIGSDGYVNADKKAGITKFFFTKEGALEEARELAGVNPKTPVLVFKAIEQIEAKRPEILVKEFNGSGELLPKQS